MLTAQANHKGDLAVVLVPSMDKTTANKLRNLPMFAPQETLDLLEGGAGAETGIGVFPLIDEANRIARATYQASELRRCVQPSCAQWQGGVAALLAAIMLSHEFTP